MTSLISNNKDEIVKLYKKFEIKSMYLFGSLATNAITEKSDVDILVLFNDISIVRYTDNYFDLHVYLEELFRRKVDLIATNSLSNPYFIKSINSTKKLLYAA